MISYTNLITGIYFFHIIEQLFDNSIPEMLSLQFVTTDNNIIASDS